MSLFDAVYAEVHAHKGGCAAIAERMRGMGFPNMTGDVLQKKVSTTCETHHLRVDELLVLMEIVNTDRIAVEIARLRFMLCIPMAQFSGVSDQELLDLVFRSEHERGQWAEACRDALQDGSIDLREMARIDKEYMDYASADAELIARLKSMVNPAEMNRGK